LASYGKAAAQSILAKLDKVDPIKKTVLLNFLDVASGSDSIPLFLKILRDTSSPPQQARAALLLGRIYNRNTGLEVGLRTLLEQPDNKELLGRLFFSDAFGLLAKINNLTQQDRLAFLATAPKDLTGSLGDKGADEFIRQTHKNLAASSAARNKEMKILSEKELEVRAGVAELLQSTQSRVAAGAIIALGQIGHPDDAKLFPIFLRHADSLVRESAAVALNRMGEPGLSLLQKIFSNGSTLEKKTIMASLANAVSNQAESLLLEGLKDPNPEVRLTALSVLSNLPPIFEKERKKLVSEAKKNLDGEKSSDVRIELEALEP
jgi:hypothetical protein